jgi:hypothetical protein
MKVEEIEKWLDTEAKKLDYDPMLPLALIRDLLSRIRELKEGIEHAIELYRYDVNIRPLQKLLEDK